MNYRNEFREERLLSIEAMRAAGTSNAGIGLVLGIGGEAIRYAMERRSRDVRKQLRVLASLPLCSRALEGLRHERP